jgi:hypothetical protein
LVRSPAWLEDRARINKVKQTAFRKADGAQRKEGFQMTDFRFSGGKA